MRTSHLAFVAIIAAGCVSARRDAVRYSIAALDTAQAGFLAYDAEHQEQLVFEAGSRAEGEASLRLYRVKLERVKAALIVAYSALSLASLDATTVHVAEAVEHVADVLEEIKKLKGDP